MAYPLAPQPGNHRWMRSLAPRHLPVFLLFPGLMVGMASTRASARDPSRVEGVGAPQASASAAPPSAAPYRVDAGRSQFFVEAEAGGVLAVFGHNHKFQVRDFTGTVSAPSSALKAASLDLSILADSLALIDKVSDDDRKEIEGTMKQKLLETSKFPKISFRSTSVTVGSSGAADSRLGVVGDLWLHGVGHSVTIPVTVVQKGDSLRATGTMKLRQTDYGMTPVTAVAGTVRVKDEVTLSFDIVATRS
jgi:polyisoprenoid-binding protein YceI